MANTEKIYRLTIQSDAAQQEVEALRKKVADLDGQLEGISKDSDIGKGIVADLAKAVAELDRAEAAVQGLARGLDDLKPGTIPALEAEIEELQGELRRATRGTAEFEAALLKLGNARGELKKLEDQLDIIADTKQHAAAFVDLANGVVGAFTVMTTAAEAWGLSQETVEEYQKKLLTLISVMDGVEQISKALNTETIGVVKSTYAAAKGWLGMGEAAAEGSKITRGALLATGLGAFIVLIGLVISNFDKIKAVAGEIRAKFKPQFDAIGSFIDTVAAKARNLASVLTFGLVDDAAKHALAVAAETRQKVLTQNLEQTARIVEILKARGADTLAIEVESARRRLETLKNSTAEEKKAYADARKDYLVLAAQLEKRSQDEEKASKLAHLGALAAIQQAKGADAFAAQLKQKREQLAQLNQAEAEGQHVAEAQRIQLQNEIDAAQFAHDAQQAEKRRALREAYLVADLARLQASTTDASNIEVAANTKQIELAKAHRANLLAQAQVDRAAVVAADAELYRLRVERQRLYYKEAAEIEASQVDIRERAFAAMAKKDAELEQRRQSDLNRIQAAGARVTQRIADELAAELALKQMKAAAQADIAGNLFIRLFGISDAKAQELKIKLAEFALVAGNLITGLLATAQASADEQLSQAQARLQSITEQLGQAQSAADATAQQLEGSVGARRDYLIQKLQAERAETERLAASKAKAAKAEQDAEKQKQKLAKESAQLSAAAALASTIATGADAVRAAVGVIAGASTLVFPANLVAITTGLGVVTAAVLQAKQLAKSFGDGGRLGDGGIIVGGSHASGNDVPVMGGRYRVEGKEMITNVRSTENNSDWLHFINREGKNKRLTLADFAEASNVRVLPHPTGRTFGDGGQLGSGGAGGVPAGAIVVQSADLAELLDTNRAMLAHLQVVSNATATTAGYGPAKLQIGPGEAQDIEAQRQRALQAEAMARL